MGKLLGISLVGDRFLALLVKPDKKLKKKIIPKSPPSVKGQLVGQLLLVGADFRPFW